MASKAPPTSQSEMHLLAGKSFLSWYFVEMPFKIAKGYFQYAKAFMEVFSLIFLLRTLFSPWKSITDPYPENKLNLGAVAYAFSLNMTTRGVGCVVRLFAIAFSIVIHVVLMVVFSSMFVFWLSFPLLAVYGIGFLLYIF